MSVVEPKAAVREADGDEAAVPTNVLELRRDVGVAMDGVPQFE